jgi:hypothetical protein
VLFSSVVDRVSSVEKKGPTVILILILILILVAQPPQ